MYLQVVVQQTLFGSKNVITEHCEQIRNPAPKSLEGCCALAWSSWVGP